MCSTATSSSCIQIQNVTLSCICDFVFFVCYSDMIGSSTIICMQKICMVTMKCLVLFLSSFISVYYFICMYLLRGPHSDEDSKPSSFLVLKI